uniref:DUF834 domain-containing protein n=1 Tax=Oryza meridionalis TaxID=40149 RepID=A0A0E0F5Q2_9ORYZ
MRDGSKGGGAAATVGKKGKKEGESGVGKWVEKRGEAAGLIGDATARAMARGAWRWRRDGDSGVTRATAWCGAKG